MVSRYLNFHTGEVIAEFRDVKVTHWHKVGDIVSPLNIRETARILEVDTRENGPDYLVRFV